MSADVDEGRLIAALVFMASVFGLVAAFAGEHVFGLQPCILCLYERVPYAVSAVLAAGAAFLPMAGRWRALLMGLVALVFTVGAALAVYHVGVEEHWWASVAACGGELSSGAEVGDLRELSAADLKPCDRVDWRLFGLSLAGYNVVASAILAGIGIAGARILSKKA
ncbi:MAG: disulfide bond formation protein B [Rhodospirillales bacterium]|jgi:disulfide bond formation protein DsbB|nr:disulfide bond formation protein B [Rhodospirillales bacterium]